ncbi:hypothetical protein JKP88DRAFT_260388 [Tribonema minus]|uniref:Tetratricopeptide repeat protein 29 n=1 Tax=Tribonema minus TaxID=303371 RepID=A0A836CHD2_9STRA|nr:hypothetical protein JKP88DRAFT_260388 [Tribonema minus]
MQAVATGAIAARPAMPPRKAKLRNKAMRGSAHAQQRLDRRSLCEAILVGGHVQSFIDFFYLTHRPAPVQDETASADAPPAEIVVPAEEMAFMRARLEGAEDGRQSGDTAAIYAGYNALAKYFQDSRDPRTGVYFYEKCLEVARVTHDRRGEMAANRSLGAAFDRMGDAAAAAAYHERHQELAAAEDGDAEARAAAAELVGVYRKCAEGKEASGDYRGAIELWQKSVQAARTAHDRRAEGQACYRLGRTWIELGEPLKALTHLEDFETAARELDDLEAQGQACAAIAAAYQALQNDAQALQYLTRQLELAGRTQDVAAQVQASSSLGALHARRGEHAKALDMFTRRYALARAVASAGGGGGGSGGGGSSESADAARCAVGVAQANEMLEAYTQAVTGDLKALLDWKCNRVRPGGGRRR